MKAPHKIDLTRLDKLRGQLEAARGAVSSSQEAALEAHRQMGVTQVEARRLEESVGQNMLRMDGRELKMKLSEFDEKIRLQKIVTAELFAKREPLAERATALGRLVDRCDAFAGALKYAR